MTETDGKTSVMSRMPHRNVWRDEGCWPIQDIAIEEVVCESFLQPREHLDEWVVHDYLELMQAGESFPPLVIVVVDQKYLLVDGYHRFEAAKLAKLTTVHCEIREGTLRDAILLSSRVNAQHGLRRTPADKRRAVMKVLADPEWSRWSDRQIARLCQVSPPFVGGLRAERQSLTENVISEGQGESGDTTRRYITKHGRPALMRLPARQQSSTATNEPISTERPRRSRSIALDFSTPLQTLKNSSVQRQ